MLLLVAVHNSDSYSWIDTMWLIFIYIFCVKLDGSEYFRMGVARQEVDIIVSKQLDYEYLHHLGRSSYVLNISAHVSLEKLILFVTNSFYCKILHCKGMWIIGPILLPKQKPFFPGPLEASVHGMIKTIRNEGGAIWCPNWPRFILLALIRSICAKYQVSSFISLQYMHYKLSSDLLTRTDGQMQSDSIHPLYGLIYLYFLPSMFCLQL